MVPYVLALISVAGNFIVALGGVLPHYIRYVSEGPYTEEEQNLSLRSTERLIRLDFTLHLHVRAHHCAQYDYTRGIFVESLSWGVWTWSPIILSLIFGPVGTFVGIILVSIAAIRASHDCLFSL